MWVVFLGNAPGTSTPPADWESAPLPQATFYFLLLPPRLVMSNLESETFKVSPIRSILVPGSSVLGVHAITEKKIWSLCLIYLLLSVAINDFSKCIFLSFCFLSVLAEMWKYTSFQTANYILSFHLVVWSYSNEVITHFKIKRWILTWILLLEETLNVSLFVPWLFVDFFFFFAWVATKQI